MAKHPELTGDFLHVPGYVQDADPGAVGGGKLWVDTSAGPSNYVLKIRNPANTGWVAVSGGGAGATNFPALTDTPASYAGAASYKVVVNGTETGLEFVPDAGGGSFLPLAGGIMTGDIDFANATEGIRFDDGAGVKFDGLIFDPATPDGPEVIIGNVAPDVGGPPFVRANSPVFRIGNVPVGGGFAQMEVWSADVGGYVPIFVAFTDNPGDPLDLGLTDNALNLVGTETRPTYNGDELAKLSDIAGFVRTNVGVGRLDCILSDVSSVSASGSVSETVRVKVADLIRGINGGGASLTYSLQDGGSGLTFSITGNGSSDPSACYIDYTNSTEIAGGYLAILNVKIDDGVQANYHQVAINFKDSDIVGGW